MNSRRILSGKVFPLVMLALPIALLLCSSIIQSQQGAVSIRAGIVYDQEDPWQSRLYAMITERPDIIWLDFSPEEQASMETQVKTGQLTCGYVFHDDMEQQIRQGKMKNLMTLVKTPQSVGSKLISESVLAAVLSMGAPDLAANELVKAFDISYDEASAYVVEQIAGYQQTQNFVQPETIYEQGHDIPQEAGGELIGRRVLHGVIALFILTSLIFLMPRFIMEKQSGIGIKLGYRGACGYYGSLFLSMACLLFLSGLLSLLLLRLYAPAMLGSLGQEAALLLLYTAAVSMTALFLIQLLRKSDWIYAGYVFILIITIGLGGILFDLNEINPWLGSFTNYMPTAAYINSTLYGPGQGALILFGFLALGLCGSLVCIRNTCRVR